MAKTPSTSKNSRAKQDRTVQTRNKILDSAADLLVGSGFQGLNTNAIAAHAGVNISTVYAYFPHKEAILESLLDRVTETQIAMFSRELAKQTSKKALIERVLDTLLAQFIKEPWLMAVHEAFAASPQMKVFHERAHERLIKMIADQFPASKGGLKVSGKQQIAVLTLALEIFMSGLHLAVKAPKAKRALIMKELKLMLNGYLDNYR